MAYFPTKVLDNQIKALPTVSTASGNVASFDTDMTENLVSCVCDIQYSQASGTPSPSNPLPITTYSEMNVVSCGENLFDLKQYCTDNGVSYTENNGIITFNANLSMYNNPFVFSDTDIAVTLSVFSIGGTAGNVRFELFDSSDNVVATMTSSTPNVTGTGCKIRFNYSTGGTVIVNKPACYTNGTTHNIPFGQTVAKGTLNVTTGVLEITHMVVDLGTLNFSQGFSGFYTTNIKDYIEIPTTVANSQLVSSIYSVGNTANSDQMYIQFNASYLGWVVFLPSTSYATASDFKTAMNGIPLVYKLKEPTYIQLSAQTITALLSENNIWCDTNGDTSVKFILSVGEYINQNV